MKKIIDIDKILILIMVSSILSFLKFIITVSIGNDLTPLFDVLIIDILILAILFIYEEIIKPSMDNKKEINDNENKEIEDKEHEENN
jgi:hypothetical protein